MLQRSFLNKHRKKGFTLIELIIVITIMGILATMIIGNFFTSLKKGRDARRKGDLDQIQKALEMYYEDKKTYPTFANFPFGSKFCETISCPAGEKVYMQRLSDDPISSKHYEYISDGTYYKLFACLENNLQVLPYQSTGSTLTCGTCEYPAGTQVSCIWGVNSSNVAP